MVYYDDDDLINNPDQFVDDAFEISNFECNRNYGYLVNNLKNKFYQATRKDSAIYFYGSRVYGLANDESDLDIFLDYKNESIYYADTDRENDAKLLSNIRTLLYRDNEWDVQLFLPDANVPLLRARYIPKDINCDLIVSNGLGVQNSNLLKHLIEIQPEFQKLFFFIRMWLECHNIQIKNYTLTLLAIFFLQQNNLMPSIERVQRNLEENYIDDWNVAFDDGRSLCSYGTRKIYDYKNHVVDFFSFYSNYDFDDNVMSTHDGNSINRAYYEYQNFFIKNKPICITGLLRKNYNCASKVGKKVFNRFINCCEFSVENFEENAGGK